ncbi:hypothetical protein SAMD00019534_114080 [Acytostelium subglobosum LB1]|uniref:hypothetical protein n=1 Tax=Acytostelium subglobosum LB1 TaxID=1410327 RepID=UPI00064518E6|nr:hypothetical protein SAMD00019534_114080 [Acytostelium subglobosum LB1]GAM28232.1 hypothetical protein SAMD00019534_114080 [Acytostelium subglobosum LB1]|eukprot:XP_012748866.1 hypothetical protein SAMD00019534_114080 [Acytostelium subglobosum LB1]
MIVVVLLMSSPMTSAETLYGLLTIPQDNYNCTQQIQILNPANANFTVLMEFNEAVPEDGGSKCTTVDNKNNIMYSIFTTNGGGLGPILKSYLYTIDLKTQKVISRRVISKAPLTYMFVEVDYNTNTGNLNLVVYNYLTSELTTGHLTLTGLDIVVYDKVHFDSSNIINVAAGYYPPENLYMVYYQSDTNPTKTNPLKMYNATSGKVVRSVTQKDFITTMQYMPYYPGTMVLGASGEISLMDVVTGNAKPLVWTDTLLLYTNQAVGESTIYLSAQSADVYSIDYLITVDVTTTPPTIVHNVTSAGYYYDQLIVSLN